MGRNKDSVEHESNETVIRYRLFCFNRDLEPKDGRSLEKYNEYTRLNELVKSSIFGDEDINKDVINQILIDTINSINK